MLCKAVPFAITYVYKIITAKTIIAKLQSVCQSSLL